MTTTISKISHFPSQISEKSKAINTGFTEMNPLWIFEGYDVSEPNLIVLGVAQDYEKMKQAPPRPGNHYSNTEVRRQYNRGARASRKLAN